MHKPPPRDLPCWLIVVWLGFSLIAIQAEAAPPQSFTDDLPLQGLETSLKQSLHYLQALPQETRFRLPHRTVSVQRLINTDTALLKVIRRHPSPSQLNRYIQRHFEIIRLTKARRNGTSQALITGYYQPKFSASLRKTKKYRYPLYKAPSSLISRRINGTVVTGRRVGKRIVPFWTRREIERDQVLRGEELAWLKDPFDAYVLHIQGSGLLELRDGTVRGVHYAQSNGRQYRSIGRYLVKSKRMPLADVNMDTIRHYLKTHPKQRNRVLHYNDSFIFFAWSTPGPVLGNLGHPLTAGRSVAADQSILPPGALLFLTSRKPQMRAKNTFKWQPLHRFVLVQDTGSALKGPNRLDVYWGTGDKAGQEAGRMREQGQIVLLLKRPQAHIKLQPK